MLVLILLCQVIPEFDAVKLAIDELMKQDNEFSNLPTSSILSHLKKSMDCSDLSNYEKQITTYIGYNKAKGSNKVYNSQVAIFIAFKI